jgi:hypothetical protein
LHVLRNQPHLRKIHWADFHFYRWVRQIWRKNIQEDDRRSHSC